MRTLVCCHSWTDTLHCAIPSRGTSSSNAESQGADLEQDETEYVRRVKSAKYWFDKRSAVEALSLRESRSRSRTRLRWLHSDVNVGDGLTKIDHLAVTLIRDL